MRALPNRLAETWRAAKCDPEVEYLVIPPRHAITTHIGDVNTDVGDGGHVIDYAGIVYDVIGFIIGGLRGVEDPETGKDFELEFQKVKIGRRTYRKVTAACIDRLPKPLYDELNGLANNLGMLTEEEAEDINFTPDSSPPDSTNAESAPEKTTAPSEEETGTT